MITKECLEQAITLSSVERQIDYGDKVENHSMYTSNYMLHKYINLRLKVTSADITRLKFGNICCHSVVKS